MHGKDKQCIKYFTWNCEGKRQYKEELNHKDEHRWGVKAAGAQGWQTCHIHVPIVLKSRSFNLLEASVCVQGLLYFYRTIEISNFIHGLSYVSEIAMCSAQSVQIRHIYIATAAHSYKFHFTRHERWTIQGQPTFKSTCAAQQFGNPAH